MIQIRRSSERGHADHGWLNSRHTFSFANYVDPDHMGFRSLRVINEDHVVGGAGFGTHPHRDMEIVSYVVDGALEHRDSTGTGSVLTRGMVQRMSAGRGVLHSEMNGSQDEEVHFLQIWVLPAERGTDPGYDERSYSDEDRRDRLAPFVTPDGRDGSMTIGQDVSIYGTLLSPGKSLSHELEEGRHGWVQVVRGNLELNGELLRAGDGAAISEERLLELKAKGDEVEALVFDLN